MYLVVTVYLVLTVYLVVNMLNKVRKAAYNLYIWLSLQGNWLVTVLL